MYRSDASPVFTLEQDNGLGCHGSRQTKIRKVDDAADGWLLRGEGGLRHGIHVTIEAEAMYLLK
jgi:hypothetical protein